MIVVLALAGCQSQATPIEPSESPTSEPTLQPPEMPKEAKGDSEEAAIAFVKHYVSVLSYAANTGDVEPLRALSHPKCTDCSNYIDKYRSIYESGGFIRREPWRVIESELVDSVNRFEILTTIESPPATFRERKEQQVQQSNSDQYRLGFELTTSKPYRVTELFSVVGEPK